MKHMVASTDEIPPGGRKIIRIDGREIGIFNIEGEYFALRNSCPHQAARVCLGLVGGTALDSSVHEFRFGKEGKILRCPWHEWEYDITTGESVFDPDVRVRTYPVEVTEGQIVVSLE